jgi:hypothetical protein
MFLSYLPRGQMNFLKHRFQEAIDDLTKFMEYSDLLAVNMSPENLLVHQIQKSDLLLSIADSRLNLFVDKYPTLRPFFEKKGKEMSENYYAKKEKRRKELKPGEMENLFPREEVDEGAMTEAKMKELQYRIKLTHSDELALSFVDFCEARSVHYEAKEIVDSYLRLMRDTIDEFLRTQF